MVKPKRMGMEMRMRNNYSSFSNCGSCEDTIYVSTQNQQRQLLSHCSSIYGIKTKRKNWMNSVADASSRITSVIICGIIITSIINCSIVHVNAEEDSLSLSSPSSTSYIFVDCEDLFRSAARHLPCLCARDFDNGTIVNCDGVSFFGEFPFLPPRQDIFVYSQRSSGLQNLEAQMFTASDIPLRKVDFSHNSLRRLIERTFDGVDDTLVELNLAHNLLGDQLNPIFSANELSHLKQLQILDLSFNKLRALDSNVFRGLKKLIMLNLEGNELTFIPKVTLDGLKTLQSLQMGSNLITQIGQNSFPRTLMSLKALNLSDNHISHIDDGGFSDLAELQLLSLSRNKIRELSANAFEGLRNLQVLDLSDNSLEFLPVEAIGTLRRLKRLYLGSNNIQTIEENAFKSADLPSLEFLDLSRNSLTNLANPNVFKGLSQLKELDLAYNALRKLEMDSDSDEHQIFRELPKLEILDLSDNQLMTFPTAAFNNLIHLKKLILDYNRITAISSDIFSTIAANVEDLSLAYNLVREIPEGTFRRFKYLRLLNLHGNKIDYVTQEMLEGIEATLIGLDLGFNDLVEFPKLVLPKLFILNIAMNQLTSLTPGTGGPLAAGDEAAAPTESAFKEMTALRFLNASFNSIGQLNSDLFTNCKQLEQVDFEGNSIQYIERGTFYNSSFVKINLRANRLRDLQQGLFMDLMKLQRLDLRENQIAGIKNGAFDELPALKSLLLGGNQITTFKGDFFTHRTQIDAIDLSRNQISYLYPNSFIIHRKLRSVDLSGNKLSYFPSEILNNIRTLQKINLSRNKLQSLDNADFANMPQLRRLDLSHNEILGVGGNVFHNSTQLQWLNLQHNQITAIDELTFKGIARLNLDLSYNNISTLPSDLFTRQFVFQLESINLAANSLSTFPSSSLKKQYSFLEKANLSRNKIEQLPANSDVLVNIKDLDLSYNPLTQDAHQILLGEPKSVRKLNIAHTNIVDLPTVIESPFLRELNISGNKLSKLKASSFERATLLDVLDLSENKLTNLNNNVAGVWKQLAQLRQLRLAKNPIQFIMKGDLDALVNLEVLDVSRLPLLTHFECEALSRLEQLKELRIYGYPTLNYLEVQRCLSGISNSKLEKLSVEIKETYLQGHLQRAYSPRINELIITGDQLTTLSGSSLAGIKSPELKLQFQKTSVASIPPNLFVPLPLSTKVEINVERNKINGINTQLLNTLDSKQMNVKLMGLSNNPLMCDCHMQSMWKWVHEKMRVQLNAKYYNSFDSIMNLTCSAPAHLHGQKVADLDHEEMVCGEITVKSAATPASRFKTTSTSPPPPPTTTTTRRTTPRPHYRNEPDIIFEAPTSRRPSSGLRGSVGRGGTGTGDRRSTLTKVDTMIIGVVAGVIAFVCILILIICVVRLRSSSSSHYPPSGPGHHGPLMGPMAMRQHAISGCTCMKPSAQCNSTCYPPSPPYHIQPVHQVGRPPPPPQSYYSTLRPVPIKMMPLSVAVPPSGTIARIPQHQKVANSSGASYYVSYPESELNNQHRLT